MKMLLISLLGLGIWLPNRTSGPVREAATTFRCSPVVLNGQSLINATLPLGSQGVLRLVSGDPCSDAHKPTAFRAYLRRAGTVVRQGASNEKQTVYFVQLDELLPHAQTNDELIVESVSSGDQQVIRVLNLAPANWYPINWFPILRSKDGC